jgi:hypothetical protein
MKTKYLAEIVSVYKLLASLLRVTLGILIFNFSNRIHRIIESIIQGRIAEKKSFFILNYLVDRINPEVSIMLFKILAIALITISLAEIIFSIALLSRKRYGGIGLFITSILWIPVEILFISKFLITSKTIIIILDIIIIVLLFKIIRNPHRYFKEKNK